jgi:hypothetical protein
MPLALLERLFEVGAAVGGKVVLPDIIAEICTPHDDRY